MKSAMILVFLFIGLAAAANVQQEALDREVQRLVDSFQQGMDNARHLKDALGEDSEEIEEVEKEVKRTLADSLKKALEDVVNKIKENVHDKYGKASDLVDRAEEIINKLKELHVSATNKAYEVLEKLKGSLNDRVNQLLGKLKALLGREKRDVVDQVLLLQLDDEVLQMEAMHKFLQVVSQQHSGHREKRALEAFKNIREQVIEYLKGLHLTVKESYDQFVDYLTELWQAGMDKAREHHANLKELARDVIDHVKDMKKEAAREALEALRPYREELGNMWNELVDNVRKVLKGEKLE